jgi:hypothetical protein
VAKPSVLRASKKLCVRGGVFSLMSAAGGAATNAVVGSVAAAAGVTAAGTNFISVALISVAGGAMSEATRAFAVGAEALAEDAFTEEAFAIEDIFAGDAFAEAAFAEATFALAVEAAESAEAGVDAGEGTPCRSAAKADGPNNAKNIAATATLISLPRRERKRARTIE